MYNDRRFTFHFFYNKPKIHEISHNYINYACEFKSSFDDPSVKIQSMNEKKKSVLAYMYSTVFTRNFLKTLHLI